MSTTNQTPSTGAEGGMADTFGEWLVAIAPDTMGELQVWGVGGVIVLGALYGTGSRRLKDKGKQQRSGFDGFSDAIGEGLAAALGATFTVGWRFVTGKEMRGEPRSDATFWRPGAVRVDRMPATELGSVAAPGAELGEPIDWTAVRKRITAVLPEWAAWAGTAAVATGRAAKRLSASLRAVRDGLGNWYRWRYAARSAARLAALAAGVGLYYSPAWTMLALGAAAGTVLGLATPYEPTEAETYGPGLWHALIQVLQLGEEDQERGQAYWLNMTERLTDDRRARIVIRLPMGWLGAEGQRQLMAQVLASRVPGEWVASYHQRGHDPYVEFTPKPAPKVREPLPEYVRWEPTDDPYRIHVGETHDGPAYILTKSMTPHVGVSGETGAGKSTIAYMALVAGRLSGWLVTVIDPKQNSMVEAQGKSGVRYVTETGACVAAVAEYFTSMMAAEKFNSRQFRTYKGERPIPRLLIIDELPSFKDFVAAWWKFIKKQRGFPPVLVWFQIILMQGRSSDHRVFVGTHQFALDVFGSTMARDQVGTKLVVGETSDPSWAVAYGPTTPRVHYDDSVKGRGVISTKGRKRKKIVDGIPERVEEIQFAYLSSDEINSYLDSAPQAPAWFDNGEMAPWITQADIERADSAGAVLDYLPGGEFDPLTPDADDLEHTSGAPGSTSAASQGVSASTSVSPERMAELVELVHDQEPEEQRYTLAQASTLGIIDRSPGAARQAKSDALKRGKPFPEGEKIKNLTYYTVAELHEFYGTPDSWNTEDDAA